MKWMESAISAECTSLKRAQIFIDVDFESHQRIVLRSSSKNNCDSSKSRNADETELSAQVGLLSHRDRVYARQTRGCRLGPFSSQLSCTDVLLGVKAVRVKIKKKIFFAFFSASECWFKSH
ncbi:hypothetical protein BpHYR1_012043 [Brachionus plicatilis]|uniref:Uncharacterized protein n=1 Tax=Brachionus plicatilis TaxID=10195 RepID=A0A3M7SVB2_BRAPC|nr:hypothetical protein BpHYR1_012043 [Brachionus plicatilis]